MNFLDPAHFEIIAGGELVKRIRLRRIVVAGDEDLCWLQRIDAQSGILGVEIVQSIYGHSVRYDSGLQNFGLVAPARSLGGTLEAAETFCRTWVAHDPTHRYAWKRKR